MVSVRLGLISRLSFEPFGDLLIAPKGGGRAVLANELVNLRSGAKPTLTLATVDPVSLPMIITRMERHLYSSQAFLPLGDCEYIVLVAEDGDRDLPDVSRIRGFRVSSGIGINYRPGVWHYPITALSSPATFSVWTFLEGTSDDEQFVGLPIPFMVEA